MSTTCSPFDVSIVVSYQPFECIGSKFSCLLFWRWCVIGWLLVAAVCPADAALVHHMSCVHPLCTFAAFLTAPLAHLQDSVDESAAQQQHSVGLLTAAAWALGSCMTDCPVNQDAVRAAGGRQR